MEKSDEGVKEAEQKKLASVPNAMMNIAKSLIGSGILGLPYGFSVGGWAFSLISFFVICIISGYCMMNLVYCKTDRNMSYRTTFLDVAREAFGKVGFVVVQIILIIDVFGCTAGYMLYISQALSLLIPYFNQSIWAAFLVAFFLLIGLARTMKLISIFSLIANICMGIGLVLLLVAVFTTGQKGGTVKAFNWSTFPVFFGIVLFAFQAIELVLPVHNSMKQPKYYPFALYTVLISICLLYSGFGLACYFGLAGNTPEMLTEALDERIPGMKISVSILLLIMIMGTLQVWVFPLFEIFDNLFKLEKYLENAKKAERGTEISTCLLEEDQDNNPDGENGDESVKSNVVDFAHVQIKNERSFFYPFLERCKYWVLSTFLRFVILGVIAVPAFTPLQTHFSNFIGLVGGTTGITMAFIMPCLLHLKISWKKMSPISRFFDIAVIVFAIPSLVAVTTITIVNLHGMI